MQGKIINGFLVLGLDEEKNERLKLEKKKGLRKNVLKYYLCKCLSCDEVFSMSKQKLMNRKRQGCNKCNEYNFNDYIGRRINEWEILEYLGNHKFKCKCKCGKVKTVNVYNIINGLSKDCGCGRNQKMSDIMNIDSLVGEKYGKLTVIEKAGKNKYGKMVYKCKCECGNTINVLSNSLRTGHTLSCGCIKSATPSKMKTYLESLGYSVEMEKRLNLEGENISYMCFDLYIEELNLAIEYDGEPHFKPIDWANKGIDWAIQNLELVEYRDKAKEKACYKRGIFLLRIPFTQKNNYKETLEEVIKIITNND